MPRRIRFKTVSIPERMVDEIDEPIKEKGLWPSRSAFVREAVWAKIQEEKAEASS